MKKVLTFLVLMMTCISVFAQSDPMDADTVIYRPNQDGTFDIITGKVFPKVSAENKMRFEKERIKRQLNQLADLERRVAEQKKKVQLDSAALESNLQNINPNDLFVDELAGLVGVWKFTIKDKADEITVDSTGAFKSKKSGPGQLNVLAEGAKKISLILGETKLILTRSNDKLFENEKLAVKLRRKEEEGEKKR